MKKIIDDLKSEVTLPPGKSKGVYILLAFFLGEFGVHNFWAGNVEKGKAQLLASTVGACLCVGPLISMVTVWIDIFKAASK